jgi:hypothetical protein
VPTRHELRYGRAPVVLTALAVLAALVSIGKVGTGRTMKANGVTIDSTTNWGGWMVVGLLAAAVVFGLISCVLFLLGRTHRAVVALVAAAICGVPAFAPPVLAALALLIIHNRQPVPSRQPGGGMKILHRPLTPAHATVALAVLLIVFVGLLLAANLINAAVT